jgi:hypothetical protein
MSIFVFIFIPLGWFATGRLLGNAVKQSVSTADGKHIGQAIARWGQWLLPAVYLLLFMLGGSGDAGHGVFLFGSAELYGTLCLPIYAVPALLLYLGALIVTRDLLRGLRWLRSPASACPTPSLTTSEQGESIRG